MRGAVLYGPRDVRIDDRPDPSIVELTDAVIRLAATCICGSDLWPYRGLNAASEPAPMGHEYLRHCRRRWRRGHVDQAGAVRHRIVCRFR